MHSAVAGEGDESAHDGRREELESPVDEKLFVLSTIKALGLRAGCDPTSSEKVGTLALNTPVRVLEQRETEEWGLRAYVTTVPGSSISYTAALNEFNHSVQRFPTSAEYEAARCNYLEDIVVREALVEDAITGNNLRIKDQTLHVSTATEAQDNTRTPPEWNVSDVRDLVTLLLQVRVHVHVRGVHVHARGVNVHVHVRGVHVHVHVHVLCDLVTLPSP